MHRQPVVQRRAYQRSNCVQRLRCKGRPLRVEKTHSLRADEYFLGPQFGQVGLCSGRVQWACAMGEWSRQCDAMRFRGSGQREWQWTQSESCQEESKRGESTIVDVAWRRWSRAGLECRPADNTDCFARERPSYECGQAKKHDCASNGDGERFIDVGSVRRSSQPVEV